MKKIIINATILVDDNLNPIEIESMLDNIGQLQSSTIDCIGYRPVEDRNHHVWVYCSGDDSENLVLVNEPGCFEGVELSDAQTKQLIEEGICVAMHGYYPRADQYGTPLWAVGEDGNAASAIPADEGFFIASEGFKAECHDSQDDSLEAFWFQIAVREGSPLLSLLVADPSDEVKSAIDALYSEISKKNSTYEAVIHSQFCSAMDSRFSATDPAGRLAFAYARKVYGYQSSDELLKMEENNWNEGVCSHGLDSMTCPMGCFEDNRQHDEYTMEIPDAQDICDRIRKNLTENEMKAALEKAGFSVNESGQDLIDALCSAIMTDDVSESVLNV